MTARVQLGLQARSLIKLLNLAVAALFSGVFINSHALEAREYAVEVSVEVLSSPFALQLSWQSSDIANAYTIRRRVFGATEWGTPRAILPAGSTQFTDTDVAEGTSYEYEIQLETTVRGAGGWVNAYGYVLAGANVSWPDQKGKVLVLVERNAANSLNPEITGFERDLIGSGWMPIRRDLPSASSVADVKNLVRAEYNGDPNNVRAVILLGHVPVPYSGNIAPDLHESHRGAWPADVYYADIDGTWTDNTVNIVSGDHSANDNRPGDGKFDQSQIPSVVELEIGRIDFHNLPAFNPSSEIDLLRSYLRKNSEFRHRVFTAERRMLIRDNFGDLSGDAPAVDAWRHYRQMFGPGSFRDVRPGGFFSTLQNESFLWAYGCGGGGNTKADGVGSTTDFATQDPRAVFLVLHGSYFGDWNTKDNFLRAAIGSPNYTLASIWSGLPHWFMHPMALGRSIGNSLLLTQNNSTEYKSHLNFSAQQVHISLIGDPTLECFPVIPPRDFVGAASSNINLAWAGSTDANIVGYHVYYSSSASGPFQRLTTSPVTGNSYSHAIGPGTYHYMVRAVKLERTGSGTFYNLSQGVFTSVTKPSGGVLPQVTIIADDSQAGESNRNNGTFRISRDFADANPLTVEISVGGTAQEGIDYMSIGASVVVPGGENHATLAIVPNADNELEGEETVTIQVQPSGAYTVGSPHSAIVKITDSNQAPTISQIADQTVEAGASTGDLAFEVNDLESAATTLQVNALSSDPAVIPASAISFGGSGANRVVRIATASGKVGVVTITLTVSDGVHEASSAFELTVIPPNLPPRALPQLIETVENHPVEILLSGDDPEGQSLTFALQVLPSNGSVSGTPPNVLYTPSSNYFGTDAFSFTVNDGKTESAPAQVSIEITPRNRPPVATPLTIETLEDIPIVIAVTGTDPDDDALTFEIVQHPIHGSLTKITNGVYTYIPATNANGLDSFTFQVRDSEFVSDPAIVEIDILPRNDLPSARPQHMQVLEDQPVHVPFEGTDPDGDPLTFQVLSYPTNGVLSGTVPHVTYTPATNFFGEDSLTFVASDGSATSAVETISFMVLPVNDPPFAGTLFFETSEDSAVAVELAGFDADGDDLNFQVITGAQHGVLSGTGPHFTYTPGTNFHGEDSFTFVVNDGLTNSNPATVTLLIEAENDPPTIAEIEPRAAAKNEFIGPLTLQVLDVDNLSSELLFWAASSKPELIPTNRIAFVTTQTNHQLTLSPNDNAVGQAEITIYVSDGVAIAETMFLATITNTPPEPADDALEVSIGTVVIPISQLLVNDRDADGDDLQIVSVTQSELGRTIQLTSDTVIYYGDTNLTNDAFVYEVEDASLSRATASVTLTFLEAPRIDSVIIIGGDVRLRISGKPDSEFHVLRSLDGKNWAFIGGGTSDQEGKGEFIENGGANAPHRFYRLEWP